MMKSDSKSIRYTPARRSIRLITRKQHGAFRLRDGGEVATAFLFSGLAPAVLMALIWHDTSLSPVLFVFTSFIALTHSIGLGLPLFLICQLRGCINLVSCVVLGAFVGILPIGILAYPTQLSEFIAGIWTNGVLTGQDEMITAAIWADYIKPLIYFGLFGAWGGLVFWAVLKCWGIFHGGRQNLSDNSLTVQASTAALPLCIARKPAAPRLTSVVSAAVPNCPMDQMVVEIDQNLDSVDNGLHTLRRRATSGKDKTPAK